MIEDDFLSLGPHGFHRIAYTEWGNAANAHIVMCVHGLTRNSRDFDFLAQSLQRRVRVVCMDVAGRGRSDWLPRNGDYTFRQYQTDAAALIARVTNPRAQSAPAQWLQALKQTANPAVDWVGTSMGGLIGMLLAAQPRSPIRRLVLNDVGPFIPWAALLRLKSNLATPKRFASLAEVESMLRQACAQWGTLSDEQWRHLAEHSVQRSEDGSYVLACDPAVGVATAWGWSPEAKLGNRSLLGMELWSVWQAVQCPTLVIRGADSEVLTPDTIARMQERGPRTTVVELPGIGHAPSLMAADQIALVHDFLTDDAEEQQGEQVNR
jgi:pimeloyl-ACP methyl ester carboxylesterase